MNSNLKILAIDTTSDRLNLALVQGNRAWSRSVPARGRQDEMIFGEVDKLLRRARWKRGDLDAVAAASGPGSFTGIRVGMTFAATLAAVLKKPAVAVTLFEALAPLAAEVPAARGRDVIGIVLPAVRDEIFVQLFSRKKDGRVIPLGAPSWAKEPDLRRVLPAGARRSSVLLAGPGIRELAASSRGLPRGAAIWDCPRLKAESLAGPALAKLAKGGGAARDFAPLYLKPAYYERR